MTGALFAGDASFSLTQLSLQVTTYSYPKEEANFSFSFGDGAGAKDRSHLLFILYLTPHNYTVHDNRILL